MSEQDRALLPAQLVGLGLTSAFAVLAPGLLAGVILAVADDRPVLYVLGAGLAMMAVFGLLSVIFVIRAALYFRVGRQNRG